MMRSGNKYDQVRVLILVAESPPVYLIQLMESVFRIMCICKKWERVTLWIFEIDYTDTTTRVNITTIDL